MNTKYIENILKTSKILYIEDDIKYRDNVSKALNMKSDYVISVSCLEEAIKVYNENSIDIIITEIMIKTGTSINFIKSIRKINKNIPIIVVSSLKDTEILLEAVKLNLIDYIIKPIELKILRDALTSSVISIFDNGLYEVEFTNGAKYNFRKKILIKDEINLTLTSKEVRLLDILLYNRKILLPMDNLKDMLWENESYVSDEAFKSILNRLRKKIGKESIENISSSGYLLKLKEGK
ncbi:MAG: response regulator transcription factor [Arcobacter sp.]|nr:response regulator transcription factor [Arcobacter sp.]